MMQKYIVKIEVKINNKETHSIDNFKEQITRINDSNEPNMTATIKEIKDN